MALGSVLALSACGRSELDLGGACGHERATCPCTGDVTSPECSGAVSTGAGGTAPSSLGVVTAVTGLPLGEEPDRAQVEQLVGSPCVNSREAEADYWGSSYYDISLLDQAPDCGGLYCLEYRFQGRASCPYGQSAEAIATLPASDSARCRTPAGEAVSVPVAPQLLNRRAESAVVCSCRCDGSDPEASYCACPSGTECTDILSDNLKEGFLEVAGSYCIPSGSVVAFEEPPGATCDRTTASCGNDGSNP